MHTPHLSLSGLGRNNSFMRDGTCIDLIYVGYLWVPEPGFNRAWFGLESGIRVSIIT